MGIAKMVAYNTMVQIIGRGTSIVLSLILVKYLTRYLGVSGYGDYATAVSFISVFAIIADFGLSIIVVRELSRREGDFHEYLSNILGLRAIVALITMLASAVIAYSFPYSENLKIGILILALASYLLSLNQVFVGVFQAKVRIDKAVLGDVIGRLVTFMLTLVFIFMKANILYIFAATFIGNLANLIISWVLVHAYTKSGLAYNKAVWKNLFMEMLPMGAVIVLGVIYIRADMIILSAVKGSEDTGIYGLAYKFFDILVSVPQFFMGALLPYIARYYLTDNDRFKAVTQKAFEILLVTSLQISLTFFILAPGFIQLIATREFLDAVVPLRILTLGLVFSFLTQMANYTLIATKHQNSLIGLYIFLIIENVGLNLWLIPHYSYVASAAITSITELLSMAGGLWLVKKKIGVLPRVKIIWSVGIASLLSGLAMYTFKEMFLLALLLGVLTYVLVIMVDYFWLNHRERFL